MNHFAHLFLAQPTVESRVGNLLGDFARGLDTARLPDEVKQGLDHHRAVDAFTDTHPEVLVCKSWFSAERRRFAGIALDMLFDHYLLRHWQRFGEDDIDNYINKLYEDLKVGRELMPGGMARVTDRIVQHDWFHAYQDLETMGEAMDRVASRIRFQHGFRGIIDEIRPMDEALEERFLSFFPDLIAFSDNRYSAPRPEA